MDDDNQEGNDVIEEDYYAFLNVSRDVRRRLCCFIICMVDKIF